MSDNLPQLYHTVAKDLVPYVGDKLHQMGLINIDPALPCFICGQPALAALVAPAPEHSPGEGVAWLTFPICSECQDRQVKYQSGEA